MKVHLDDSFYVGEERLGFYIRPIMKRVWAEEMEILSVIADICERHSIRWFADGGTMLGTVRHQGFIPWDDDIDIAMFREDFKEFIRVAPAELPVGWRLFNGAQDQDPSGIIMRVINTETVRTDPEFLADNHGCPYIMGVDIMTLDSVPDDPEEDEIFRALLTMAYDAFGKTQSCTLYRDCPPDVKEEIDQLQAALDIDVDCAQPVKRQMLGVADMIAQIYNHTGASCLGIEPFYVNRPEVRLPVSCYADVVMMDFETIRIAVPTGYDQILRICYGDEYMTPRQVGGHAYPCIGKAEELLREYYAQKGERFPAEFE